MAVGCTGLSGARVCISVVFVGGVVSLVRVCAVQACSGARRCVVAFAGVVPRRCIGFNCFPGWLALVSAATSFW